MMKKLLAALALGTLLSFQALAAVDLNTANRAELESVKGIGPKKAQAIVDYRTQNGPFKSVDELAKVKGFGKASVSRVRNELTVSGAAKE